MIKPDAMKLQKPGKLAIVIPCYNEEEALPQTLFKMTAYLDYLVNKSKVVSRDSFILLVDDGSADNTWNVMLEACEKYTIVNALKLTHNVGHQNALLAGLLSAANHSDFTISIDADLQDDYTTIEKMVEHHDQGSEIVFGVRKSRKIDSFFKRTSAQFFYRLMAAMGTRVIYNHADYRLMSRKALEALAQHSEVNLFLRGIISNLGFKTTTVYYDRLPRKAGSSKYTLFKMLRLSWEGITSFSVRPLQMITAIGFSCFAFSVCGSIYIIYGKFMHNTTVPGWASSLLTYFFLGGMQLLSTGLLGEYIGKIYQEVKHRPRYFVENTIGREFESSRKDPAGYERAAG